MTEEEFRDWEAAVRCESPRQAAQPAKNVADGVYWDKSGDKWMSGPMLMDWVRSHVGKAIATERGKANKSLEECVTEIGRRFGGLRAEVEALKTELEAVRKSLPPRVVPADKDKAA